MNWLKEAVRYRGGRGGLSNQYYPIEDPNFDNPDQLYTFPQKNPVVFLGANDQDDVEQVQRLTGYPPGLRINVAEQDSVGSWALPTADISFSLPEHKEWNEQSYAMAQQEFNQAVQQTVAAIRQATPQSPLYIHCSAGINRSASVLAAALTEVTGQPLVDILQDMKSRRAMISPHDAYFMMATDYSKSDSPEWKSDVQRTLDLDQNPEEQRMTAENKNWLQRIASLQPIAAEFGPSIEVSEAVQIGRKIGVDWDRVSFSPKEFVRGIEVEFEHSARGPAGHAGDVINGKEDAARIALAHLMEMSDYYRLLANMESKTAGKRVSRDSLANASFGDILKLVQYWGYNARPAGQGGSHWALSKPGFPSDELVKKPKSQMHIVGMKETLKRLARANGVSLDDFLAGKKSEVQKEVQEVAPAYANEPWYQEQQKYR